MVNPVANGPLVTSMESRQADAVAVALTHRLGGAADAKQVAAAMGTIWREIHQALRPIVGERGIAALFQRSLYLTALAHPWLAQTIRNDQIVTDLEGLSPVFAQQSREAAAAGAATLLQTFCGLLASLIGLSLTEQLLRPLGAGFSGKKPTPDSKP